MISLKIMSKSASVVNSSTLRKKKTRGIGGFFFIGGWLFNFNYFILKRVVNFCDTSSTTPALGQDSFSLATFFYFPHDQWPISKFSHTEFNIRALGLLTFTSHFIAFRSLHLAQHSLSLTTFFQLPLQDQCKMLSHPPLLAPCPASALTNHLISPSPWSIACSI